MVKVHVDRLATCDAGVCAAFIPKTTNMLLLLAPGLGLLSRLRPYKSCHLKFWDVRMSIAFSVSPWAVYGCY